MVDAPAAVALLVLAVAGAAKLVDPIPTSGALAASGLPSGVWGVRMLGIAEMTMAGFGLVLGGAALGLGALAHLAFLAFTASSMRRATPLQSCGCFGREDTPPSVIHVIYNGLAMAALAGSAFGDGPIIPSGTPFDTSLYIGFAALAGFAVILLLTRLPVLLSVMRAR